MKAIILAAGKGKRMGELTKNLPKPLLNINNRPFLLHTINILKENRINEIGIVVSYQKEKIAEFLKENKIRATLIDQHEPLGTGHAVKVTKEFTNNEDFLVLNGDNYYFSETISDILKQKEFNIISAIRHKNPERFGVLIEEKGFLKKIIEKSPNPPSNLINAGLYKFTPEIFEALEKIKLSERGEYELTDALTLLAEKQRVKVMPIEKEWFDLATPEDVKKLEDFLS